jgi:hypothetical protein
MWWVVPGMLLILWLLGFSMNAGGGFVHAMLMIAIVVLLFNRVGGRRSSA